MGAFNTLKFEWIHQPSKKKYNVVLQFKYAELWQYEYKIGDTLRWGDHMYNDGDKSAKEVLVEATVESDGLPQEVPEKFEIFIKDNIIQDAYPLIDKMKYFNNREGYVILR